MSNKPPFTALACLILLFMTITTNQSSSARTLGNSTPNPNPNPNPTHHNHHSQQKITFLMRDIFNTTNFSIPKVLTSTTSTHDLPFSKPIGLLPPNGAALLPESANLPSSPRTLDLPGIGLSFPAKATLQELEFGVVTDIEEEIYHPSLGYDTYGSQLLGKAQGMFVASSEDGRSHMMAMKVRFHSSDIGDQDENGLRFFGVKKADVNESQESHIAVIGGVGKFQGANGYATVKSVSLSPNGVGVGKESGIENRLLKFSVYLS